MHCGVMINSLCRSMYEMKRPREEIKSSQAQEKWKTESACLTEIDCLMGSCMFFTILESRVVCNHYGLVLEVLGPRSPQNSTLF